MTHVAFNNLYRKLIAAVLGHKTGAQLSDTGNSSVAYVAAQVFVCDVHQVGQ